MPTPMVVSQQLSSAGDAFHDPTLFRSMVGALQYLTITHPNLTYAVNSVSQHMQSPTGLTFKPSNASFGMLKALFTMVSPSLFHHQLVLLPTLTLIGLVALILVAPPPVMQSF